MAYNLNHGWGKLVAEAVKKNNKTGKVLIVAASTLANWEELNEIFPPSDKVRVLTTLQEAIDLVGDGEDDLILVAPSHTETVIAAGGLDTGTDTAGLSIIGLGQADERPLISFTTATTADIDVGSNGITIENVRFDMTGIDALAGGLDINSSGFTLKNCEVITADATGQAEIAVVTDANADDMVIDGCKFIGSQTTGTKTAIRIIGGDNIEIKNCHFKGNYKSGAGAIEVTTTAAGNLLIKDNIIFNNTVDSVSAMSFVTGTTAVVTGNILGIRSGTTPIFVSNGANTSYILTAKNYYRAASAVAAGTLL